MSAQASSRPNGTHCATSAARKARRGEIPEFTGISSPYEEPADADVRVDTTGRSIDEALEDVIAGLREAGYLDLA
ncbi:adenylyl-sulfate kinase [Nocardioides sp. NPDC057772]|uniref:adenylyl-sulfate kinase n=1 Tax=Nocardioides sp. NPDC057772 TaxID=3346245 RepID=UPI00366B7B42